MRALLAALIVALAPLPGAAGEPPSVDPHEIQRDWIRFRDARCAYDRLTSSGGIGGAVAEPLCKLQETARQVVLLMAYRRDRT